MARISIIGSGVVGAIAGNGFLELKNDVIFFDVDTNKVNQFKKNGKKATIDIGEAISNSDISFIAVPTPSTNGKIDLSYIKMAAESIGKELKKKSTYHTVVVKSTVIPRTTEDFVKPILEQPSGKKVGDGIGLCMNPEFLTEIHNSWSDDASMVRGFFTEERIVIGEFDKKSGDVVEQLYKPLNVPIFRTNLRTAEMVKYACNCALASRISYWNEIYYICQKLGVDSEFVANVAAADKRIGKYGAIHGKAFGGKCFPKDLQAIIAFSESVGYEPQLLKAVRDVNERIGKDKGVRE
jgi:UDPglucose 6-dehydrogenase